MSEIGRFVVAAALITAVGFTLVVVAASRVGRQPVGEWDETGEVQRAVLLSDQLEVDAERYLRTDQLSRAYADQALQETSATVEALKRKGQYRVSELKGIDFQKVELEGGARARVQSVERWVYSLFMLNGRKLGYADVHEVPQVNYLEKRGPRWYVVRVEFSPAPRPVWHAEPPQLSEQQVIAAVLNRAMASNAQLYLSAANTAKSISATYDGEGDWTVKVGQFSWRVDDGSSEVEPSDSTTLSFERGTIKGPGNLAPSVFTGGGRQ